jgi:RHS repeat-associated protein
MGPGFRYAPARPHRISSTPQWPIKLLQGGPELTSEDGPRLVAKRNYFGARYYASSMGRFMSPDYDETGDDIEPVPYAAFDNPQTLNLYSYVLNNPLKSTDESGHTHQECGAETTSTNANGDTVVNANCHDVPDWWNFGTNISNSYNNFKNWVNHNVEAHRPPPQKPNGTEALQDINNIMMGLVPVGGAAGMIDRTLKSIKETGKAPAGQQGGREFMNDGRGGGQQLPQQDANGNPIKYQEWDVNAKQPGVNRGAERLVTGSDGSAYYTSDHYQSFTRVE